MDLLILNYSETLSNEDLNNCIEDLMESLESRGINTASIRVENASRELYEHIRKVIDCLGGTDVVVTDKHIQSLGMDYYVQGKSMVFVGENLATKNPWGDAWGSMCVIRKVEKAVIWHEIAHLLGAEDHYSESYLATENCKKEDCLMRYGILEGDFCHQTIIEIKKLMMEITDN